MPIQSFVSLSFNLFFQIPKVLMEDIEAGEVHSVTSFVEKYAGKAGIFKIGKDKLTKEVIKLVTEKKLKKRVPTDSEKQKKRNLKEVLDIETRGRARR